MEYKSGDVFECESEDYKHLNGKVIYSHIQDLGLQVGDRVRVIGSFVAFVEKWYGTAEGTVIELVPFKPSDPIVWHGAVTVKLGNDEEHFTDCILNEYLLEKI